MVTLAAFVRCSLPLNLRLLGAGGRVRRSFKRISSEKRKLQTPRDLSLPRTVRSVISTALHCDCNATNITCKILQLSLTNQTICALAIVYYIHRHYSLPQSRRQVKLRLGNSHTVWSNVVCV